VLLLRASGELNGTPVDLRAVVDPACAAASGVPGAEPLLALADALVGDDDAALARARERMLRELGPAVLVDAIAVAANFERMVRIADGTGIPLDAPVEIATSDVRGALGIDRYTAAANTPLPGALRRLLTPLVRPLLARLMRAIGGRVSRPVPRPPAM
jgi:hypothetical protein